MERRNPKYQRKRRGTTIRIKKKPLKIEVTSLLNHLKLIQKSIFLPNSPQNPHSRHHESIKHLKPNLELLNFQSTVRNSSNMKSSAFQDWYILVASTPYAISAQLISVPTEDVPDIVVPDFIQCTPISVWTCSDHANYDDDSGSKGDADDNGNGSRTNNHTSLEILSCDPRILIQEPTASTAKSEHLQVSIVCGTSHNHVLSVQLSIFAYVGMQGCEGRYVLSKTQREEGVVEPLKLDTDEVIRERQLKKKAVENQSSGGTKDDSTMSVTSASRDENASSSHVPAAGENDTWVPFRPKGGVQSISAMYKYYGGSASGSGIDAQIQDHIMSVMAPVSLNEFLWVTYGDGTFVRMPKWAFFGLGDVSDLDHPSHLCKDLAFKGRLDLKKQDLAEDGSDAADGIDAHVIVPLPKFFPTLMSQPLDASLSNADNGLAFPDLDLYNDEPKGEEEPENEQTDHDYEFYEAICYKKESKAGDTYPTIAFYTNEDQLFSNMHKTAEEEVQMSAVQNIIRGGTTIIGGTAALAKNMFGGMMGVLTRSNATMKEGEMIEGVEVGVVSSGGDDVDYVDRSTRASLFPVLHDESTVLRLSSAHYDAPRRITHVAVDTLDGSLMACADNLGRVQLVNLETKQTIRLWKGFREATCHWIQFPYTIDGEVHTVKYLAIHSRQRNVVEIFRMNNGPRVGKFDVKSDGVSLVQCPVNLAGGEMYERSFELRISRSSAKSSILKEVCVVDDELITASREGSSSVNASYGNLGLSPAQKRAQEGTIQMQLLKQLVSSESAVPSDLFGVYDALTQITAISDLSKALDLLALATHLVDMGVKDSCFHSEVVLHARDQLDIFFEDQAVATSKNIHIEELSTKIDLHTQIILTFDEIHEFEHSEQMNNSLVVMDSPNINVLMEEAIAWRQTFEKVTGRSIDADLPSQAEPKLTFATFAKGCLQDGSSFKRNKAGNLTIPLCDSTRDRKQILLHMFGPLTKDIFSSKTTHQAFENLGLNGDFDTLLQYYGEWFMSLPRAKIEKQCDGILCPIVRWLHDMVLEYMESNAYSKAKNAGNIFLLQVLHKYCADSTDLPRAFLLAVVCREAVFTATQNIEDRTYGLISCKECVKPWKDLLQNLRVCLLISLRLDGIQTGALPVTVSHVNAGDIFSIHQFIAHDELSITNDSDKIAALEMACFENPIVCNPSLVDGDEAIDWKLLQAACRERDNPDDSRLQLEAGPAPLLIFLLHYFDPVNLASHRALILAQKWGRDPYELDSLEYSLAALRTVDDAQLLSAIAQEIWNNHLRPVYRGALFGFHEVDEICEEVISPLCDDPNWLHTLNRLAIVLIGLLRSTVDVGIASYENQPERENLNFWPPLQKDTILDSHVKRADKLDDSSLETHGAIICALQLTDDFSTLQMCFPTLETLFLRESLIDHQPLSLHPNEYQTAFIEDALRRKAVLFEADIVNYDDLDDLVTLGRAWGVDKSSALTEFLIIMHEVGKDHMVQHLMTSTRLIEIERFQEGGMAIACVRLDAALVALKQSKECRGILAMLDADTCEWVKEQAEISKDNRSGKVFTHGADDKLIPLDNTHELILRIKRMSSANRIDAAALSTMCDTLLKASETFA